jgi:hypothetical protein
MSAYPTYTIDTTFDGRVGGQVETREHVFNALFDLPAIALFELVLETSEFLEQGRRPLTREIDRRSMVRRDQRAQVAEAVGNDIEDGSGR